MVPLASPRPTGRVPDVTFVPTPEDVVEVMLDLAGVTCSDVVYDLGSGDGRIVIAAARRGARAVGVELDGNLIEQSTRTARQYDLGDRAAFVQADIFSIDLSIATVVAIYLLPSMNLRLRPKLLRELAPGARVVSHAFDMDDWMPDGQAELNGRELFLWRVPMGERSYQGPIDLRGTFIGTQQEGG
jgi:SAM-dependent methyltransferase